MSIMRCKETPIRVLHVVTYMGRGGLETMIMNYYRKIDRDRLQFDFLVHRSFKADYDDEIEALGGKIYRLPKLIPWDKSYQRELHCFFKEHPEYKIIHVHQDCLSSVILKVAKAHGVRVRIAHSHNSSQDKNLKYPIKLFYKRFIPKHATDLFACSAKAGDWMFDGASYRILNNAIDTTLYKYDKERRREMRRQLNIPPNTFVIGHVGRFDAVKNQTFLIELIETVKLQIPEIVLLLVGDGALKTMVENKVKQSNLEDRVIFTGIRSDVADLMQAMDCFVFPSLYEGLPVALVEAQAAGLPCIVSTGVTKESDKTGLLKHVSLSDDMSAWINAIIFARETERKNTSEELILSGYDITKNAEWLQAYYLEKWREVK